MHDLILAYLEEQGTVITYVCSTESEDGYMRVHYSVYPAGIEPSAFKEVDVTTEDLLAFMWAKICEQS